MSDNIIVTVVARVATGLHDWAKNLTPTEKVKALSHIIIPGLLLGIPVYSGGWAALGFEKQIAISELRSEITASGSTPVKKGFVLIAEPESDAFEYVLPIENGTARFWVSMDQKTASDNFTTQHLTPVASGLQGKHPLIRVTEPLAVVGEGDLGEFLEITGRGKESITDLRLSSRRPLSLVLTVLFNCFLALGMGVVTGFPSVDPDENNTRKVRTKPNKK